MSKKITRRNFVKGSVTGALSFPTIVPHRVFVKNSPGNTVSVAAIGCGSRAKALVLKGFSKVSDARVIAAIDPFKERREEFVNKLNKIYKHNVCKPYEDYREVLKREDIDAVVVATADHWHVPIAIAAAKAKKDMYVEKPLGVSMEWAKILRRHINDNKLIFQYGTQQRSSQSARTAMDLVWNGYIGEIKRVDVWCPHLGNKKVSRLPEKPLPPDFNYDLWQGPAPVKPYQKERCERFGIYHIYDYALGFIAGWGAHPLDILQWGLKMDHTAPIEYSGKGTLPEKHDLFNTIRTWDINFKYANNITGRFMDSSTARPIITKFHNRFKTNGTIFYGTEGWVCFSRGACYFNLDGKYVNANKIKFKATDKRAYPNSLSQHHNFIECVKTRKPTVNPVESAIRGDTISHMSNIAIRTGRKIKWDPVKELIINDAEASRMLDRPARKPYNDFL